MTLTAAATGTAKAISVPDNPGPSPEANIHAMPPTAAAMANHEWTGRRNPRTRQPRIAANTG